MQTSVRLLALALLVIPAAPAFAAAPALAAPALAAPTRAAPARAAGTTAVPAAGTVAKYTFDAGISTTGHIAENSGRGVALAVRTADRGTVRAVTAGSAHYVAFPAACAKGATCPRALLEAPDDPDLNPGTRTFSWGASIAVNKSAVIGSSNVVQKGISTIDSQWKLQIGAARGVGQCVLVGRGSATAYVARSSIAVADGKWHKVACQRAGTALTIVVDGVNRGRITVPATLDVTNTHPVRIGGPNFNTRSDMYHGLLDDVYATLG